MLSFAEWRLVQVALDRMHTRDMAEQEVKDYQLLTKKVARCVSLAYELEHMVVVEASYGERLASLDQGIINSVPASLKELTESLTKNGAPKKGTRLEKGIQEYLRAGLVIDAIKWVRNVYPLGLREAKSVVDKHRGM